MTEFAKCECVACYRLVPKPEATRVSVWHEKSRSGGSARFGKTFSFTTGRSYYQKKDVWLCSSCAALHQVQQRKRRLVSAGTIAAILLFFIVAGMIGKDNGMIGKDNRQQVGSTEMTPAPVDLVRTVPEPTASVARAEVPLQRVASVEPAVVVRQQTPPEATASRAAVVLPEVRPEGTASKLPKQAASQPGDVKRIQDRLIELRYLDGVSDGRWGPKSRAALREFKSTNGLTTDDKWDDVTNARLFSGRAVRSQKLPTARVQ